LQSYMMRADACVMACSPVRLSGRGFWFDSPPAFTLNLDLSLNLL